eukprot:2450406-Amphidinium_carterae.1
MTSAKMWNALIMRHMQSPLTKQQPAFACALSFTLSGLYHFIFQGFVLVEGCDIKSLLHPWESWHLKFTQVKDNPTREHHT